VKIFVVFGTTGEYSDRSEWLVKAYKKEKLAQEHVTNAEMRAKEIQCVRPNEYEAPKRANKFDPNMQMDYTGTSYYYASVDLI
jgi:hypothetical protein